jgi:hypothetical protein
MEKDSYWKGEMKNFGKYLEEFFHILQIFDSSLGIDISEEQINIVQTKKTLKGNKIIKQTSFAFPASDNQSNFISVINENIEKYRLESTYTVLNHPTSGALIKSISIPVMPAPKIKPFLQENSDLFLPTNLNFHDFLLNYKIISSNEAKIQLLVFMSRKNEIENLLSSGLKINNLFKIYYRGLELENLLSLVTQKFSGIIINPQKNNFLLLQYESGNLINCEQVEKNNLFSYTEIQENYDFSCTERKGYLISGDDPNIPSINKWFINHNYYSFNDQYCFLESKYLNAFALSLSPFLNNSADVCLSTEHQEKVSQQAFFKQLTLKAILAGGTLIIIFYLFSLVLNFLLNWRGEKLLAHSAGIQPLVTRFNSLTAEQVNLEKMWSEYNLLARQKSHYAYYLYRIAESLPQRCWIRQISIILISEKNIEFQAYGFALSEEDITSFLGHLEKQNLFKEIVLAEMIINNNRQAYKKWKLNYPKLIEFRVCFHV